MTLEDSLKIISENYPQYEYKSNTIDNLLEISKGATSSGYRPYYVIAYLIKSEYRKVSRVEEVYMSYSLESVTNFLKLQQSLDKTISDIPVEHTGDNLLEVEDSIEFSAFTTNYTTLK